MLSRRIKPNALSRRPDYSPPPLPSLPIFHTPHLLGAAVLVSPDNPILLVIAATQAGDATLSAIRNKLQGGAGGESNPALPEGSPSGGSDWEHCSLQRGLLYQQGRLLIPPASTALILQIPPAVPRCPAGGPLWCGPCEICAATCLYIKLAS